MVIDKQTLKDLDIFRAEEGSASVFDLIDKTRTAGGRSRLREKLLHPAASLDSAREQQESIRYLAAHSNDFFLPFDDRQTKALEEYLSSNIVAVREASVFESAKFCFFDRRTYRYLSNSLSEMMLFINGFYRLLHTKKDDLPGILNNACHDLELMIHDESFKALSSLPSRGMLSFHRVLQADRLFRTRLKTKVQSILSWYYEVDALLAMAKATNELRFNFPEFVDTEDSIFKVEGLYHPMLARAVPSNVELNQDSNFMFLTGANMSGKTTFLKATGIAVYLAHLGMGIPAERARISYFDRVFTSLNITDSIFNGDSFFFSEVKRVKQLAEALNSGEKVFAVFDELFRGTNVKDAYDATIMVISGLALWRNCIFIVSSHLWEVWEKIKQCNNFQNMCFASDISNGVPVFSYRLVAGVSQIRLGLRIIENEKIMQLLARDSKPMRESQGQNLVVEPSCPHNGGLK